MIIAADGSSSMTSTGSSSSEEAGVVVPDEEGETGRGSNAPARLPGAGEGPTSTQSSGQHVSAHSRSYTIKELSFNYMFSILLPNQSSNST